MKNRHECRFEFSGRGERGPSHDTCVSAVGHSLALELRFHSFSLTHCRTWGNFIARYRTSEPTHKIKIGTNADLNFLVGVRGFEPPTPWSQTKYSTRLSYTPNDGYYNIIFHKCKFLYIIFHLYIVASFVYCKILLLLFTIFTKVLKTKERK